MSLLFNQPAVNDYATDDNMVRLLNGRQILTRDDIINSLSLNYMHDFVDLSQRLSKIGNNLMTEFAEQELLNAFTDSRYDVAFIVGENAASIDNIHGFIITKKPYCAKKPKAYGLDLLCIKEGISAGSILLGLYLYCIKSCPAEQIGFLDSVDSYTNLSALCLYSKFGFTIDKSFYERYQCFGSYENVAMSVNLYKMKRHDIIDIVVNIHAGFDKLPICNIARKYQFAIGALENLKLLMDEFDAVCIKNQLIGAQYMAKFNDILYQSFDLNTGQFIIIYKLIDQIMDTSYHIPYTFRRPVQVTLFKIELDKLLALMYNKANRKRIAPANNQIARNFMIGFDEILESPSPKSPSPKSSSPKSSSPKTKRMRTTKNTTKHLTP